MKENNDGHSFIEFKLARPIIRAINEMGYVNPTPVQLKSIKPILEGHDVCATAITGSGKSAAFLIPIIHMLIPYRGLPGPKALIMSPTRELTIQLHKVFEQISKYSRVTGALVVGGVSAEEQARRLDPIPDIIFATPGRIVDQLFNDNIITANHIKYYVLDEADRLLGRGFEAELTAINSKLPEEHQTLLFTATLSDQVNKLINKVQKNTLKITVDYFMEVSPTLTQQFVKVKSFEKRMPALVALCKNKCQRKTLVFLPTKQLAHYACLLFNYAGLKAAELHADLPQPDRLQSVQDFTENKVRILLASDLAARGLDISDIEYVINFTIPNEIERYIHRVGRTARAGKPGTAISLIGEAHEKQIKRKIEKKQPNQCEELKIPRNLMDEATEIIQKFDDMIKKDMEKEQEEKARRREEMETKRMKQLLDIEEEIPAKLPDESD
ncbi:DEAD-domain-containing protein [Histomonas meleagridis]|uniref:DEAD-domain-containing protein n=1 Tax=Histomonas meleagridis TaxID=135588 RepID=UPI00355A8061|nr:DEAD-domain-containing protein [Histomonas meleagridis]KAH0802475.1 DEAD-domain-containing protein [Histomonas meleagridis]